MTAPLQPLPEFDSDLLDEVRAALRKSGWLLPTTDEEIDQALDAVESADDVSASLTDPRKLFRTGQSDSSESGGTPATSLTESSPFQEDVEESLAIAAREGEEIPPEMREKMNRHREEAEQNQESSEDSSTEEPSSEENTDEER